MTVTISAEDPRSIRAIEIAASSRQWLRCRSNDGDAKAYGIPSQRTAGLYHLTTQTSCTCQDAARTGCVCKHQLAVRLVVELAKAQMRKGVRLVR